MPDAFDSRDSAVLCDFLDLFLEDQAAGRRRPLVDYLRRFPGHEEHVAREFLALSHPGDAAEGETDLDGRPAGGRLGPYRILEPLGRGGQGAVFLAEDVRLKRQVALKILEGGLGGLPATRLARLKREAEVLSRLDHPRICAVYDVDLTGLRPYLAMRYVAGETVAQRIARARSDPGGGGAAELLDRIPKTPREIDAVVRFVEQAARAVHAAHEAGIIHRDLKPGNIMIDARGEPVVLDFGLARDLEADAAPITIAGDAFGTLAYMAPEQLADDHEVDRRTDVYALGVTLYECLTFRRPVEAATRESLLKGILSGPREDPASCNRAVPRDLSVVLLCALDVDRGRRYATALAFAEDLRRVREHEPILARPAGLPTQARRLAQRHPAAFAAVASALTLLVAGLVVTSILLARVTREQGQTRREQSKLLALRQASLAQVLGNERPALALKVAIEAARRERHPEISAILCDLLDRCYEKTTFGVFRGRAWVGLGYEAVFDARGRLIVSHSDGIATFDLGSGSRVDLPGRSAESAAEPPAHLAVTPDGKTLASVHEDGALRFWDVSGEPRLVEERKGGARSPTWIAFGPDGTSIATGSAEGRVAVHPVRAGEPPFAIDVPGRSVTTARFDPSGRRLAVTGIFRRGQSDTAPATDVFDARTGAREASLGPPGVPAIWAAWSPDGSRLAVAFMESVRVFLIPGFTEEADLPHSDTVYWLEFHPGGRALVTGSKEGVAVWDVERARRVATVGGFRERSVVRGSFSPDGSRLAVISWDQTGTIIDCATWREDRKLKGMGRPRAVCWTPDGDAVVTTDEATAVRVWYASDRPHLPVLRGHGGRVVTAAFDQGGARALTASLDGQARMFDATTGRLLYAMNHGKPLAAARLVGSDRILTIGGGRVLCWDAATGAAVRELVGGDAGAAGAWALPDGRALISCADGTVRCFDVASGALLRTFAGHRGPVQSVAFHAARGWLATGGADRIVRVSDLATGAPVATLSFAARAGEPAGTDLSRVFALAFDGSGGRVMAGCEDLRVRVWALPSARLDREETVATPGTFAVSPDGRWLMAGSKWIGRVTFFDLQDPTAAARMAPFHDSHMIAAIGFSPGGEYAMAAASDGAVHLWNMDDVRPHVVIDARCGIVLDAAFSPDGKRVIVGGADGIARIWPVDPFPVAERACPVDDRTWELLQTTLDASLVTR